MTPPRRGRIRQKVLQDVAVELSAQDDKWGTVDRQRDLSDNKRLAILAEEFGEYAQAVNEHDEEQQRLELIRTAAVAIANVELLDIKRNGVDTRYDV